MLLQQTVEPGGTVYDTDGFDTVLNQPVKDEVAADRQAVQLGAISARSQILGARRAVIPLLHLCVALRGIRSG